VGQRGATVGVVANPASGRDIRRLVAQASVFPASEKANMVQRLLGACGSLGVSRALLSIDLAGISAATLRAQRSGRNDAWPQVHFCEEVELTDTAADTTNAIRCMRDRGVDAIACLGGDGTARVAASACGDVPLLPLSTGTNNAFPRMREATVAGMALALVATGQVDPAVGTRRASALEVRAGQRRELALVDVCVSSEAHVGSRAVWNPDTITELYCTFAEPDGIGLSSVPGLLCPSAREEPDGVAMRLAPPASAKTAVRAPIAPGLVVPVGVDDWEPLRVGDRVETAPGGVVAVDGERELELRGGSTAEIVLRGDGPRCVDVPAVLAAAAERGVLSAAVPNSSREVGTG
jgi:predicted polyphosphate/ATP-dependent NAD kinase